MLRELTENLQVAVPARFSHPHDIGSLWPPLRAKLKKIRTFVAAFPTLCDDIDFHGWVRNTVGAHYNESASGPTPKEVLDFAVLLAELYAATYCQSCTEFIAKVGDDQWKCAAGCIKYSSRSPTAGLRIVNA